MKIKIFEYQCYRSNKVRVQSHKKHKGKWKENPNYEFHKKIASGMNELSHHPLMYKKEYEKELREIK